MNEPDNQKSKMSDYHQENVRIIFLSVVEVTGWMSIFPMAVFAVVILVVASGQREYTGATSTFWKTMALGMGILAMTLIARFIRVSHGWHLYTGESSAGLLTLLVPIAIALALILWRHKKLSQWMKQ